MGALCVMRCCSASRVYVRHIYLIATPMRGSAYARAGRARAHDLRAHAMRARHVVLCASVEIYDALMRASSAPSPLFEDACALYGVMRMIPSLSCQHTRCAPCYHTQRAARFEHIRYVCSLCRFEALPRASHVVERPCLCAFDLLYLLMAWRFHVAVALMPVDAAASVAYVFRLPLLMPCAILLMP